MGTLNLIYCFAHFCKIKNTVFILHIKMSQTLMLILTVQTDKQYVES